MLWLQLFFLFMSCVLTMTFILSALEMHALLVKYGEIRAKATFWVEKLITCLFYVGLYWSMTV
jgi:hypothetical protein